jgi:hypothetical protein
MYRHQRIWRRFRPCGPKRFCRSGPYGSNAFAIRSTSDRGTPDASKLTIAAISCSGHMRFKD